MLVIVLHGSVSPFKRESFAISDRRKKGKKCNPKDFYPIRYMYVRVSLVFKLCYSHFAHTTRAVCR